MDKKTMSIRAMIIASFIILMVITLTTISLIIFTSWNQSSNSIIEKMENDVTKDIVKEIDHILHVSTNMNEIHQNMIANDIIDLNNKKELDVYFAGAMQSSNKEIYSFSYGVEESGDYYGARRNARNEIELFRSNSETNGHSHYYSVTENLHEGRFIEDFGPFDPRTRDWYQIAKLARKPIFTPPYKHFVEDDLVLKASYPIINEQGVLQGVLGTTITLTSLNQFLKELVSDRNVTAYVVEKSTGNLVANSVGIPNFRLLSDGSYERVSIDYIENKAILDAFKTYQSNTDNKNTVIDSENDKLHLKFTEFQQEGVEWIIITGVPNSLFTTDIYQSFRTAILLSLIALLLLIFIYKKITDTILQPINDLIQVSERYSKGDLVQRAKVYKNNEIGKLSKAFNKMADELYKHIHYLEVKVKQRTAEIEKTNRELKYAKIEADKANEAKSAFLANMSHEIRTPLNSIIGFSELLSHSIEDPKHKSYIDTINVSGNSLLLIINDILDLSKIEAGKVEVHDKPVNIKLIFKEIEMMFLQKKQTKGIEFFLEIHDDVPDVILFDEVRIRQILLNLVGNAIKFTEKGHVKVSIKTLPTSTRASGSIDLQLIVEDTGIGIAASETKRIFEPFTQISGQSIKKYGGTGLGLSITKKLVEMLNGTLSVESAQGKGSTFYIEFPNVQIAATDSLPNETEDFYFWKYSFTGETILVVDDIETNRYLLKEWLTKSGIRVILAGNGCEALKACELKKPDLIITDIDMPVMDGIEATAKLKENPETSSIPIIVISASNIDGLPQDVFDDFLLKPVNPGQLLDKIAKLLQNESREEIDSSIEKEVDHLSLHSLNPEVVAEISHVLSPLLMKVESSLVISDVKSLAQKLITIGQKYQIEFLIAQGKELMGYAECYDIVKMKLKINGIKNTFSRGK